MMMGYGSYGSNSSNGGGAGGSMSSPSNLSALAPPFTVDRSMSKPVTNPLFDITDAPSYAAGAATFDPTSHNWVSPPPQNDYFLVPNRELDLGMSYGYASNEAAKYSYGPAAVEEFKPYYPVYFKQVIGDDGGGGGGGGAPSGVNLKSGFDLLPTASVRMSYPNLDHEYTKSFSGVEHSAHWSNLWDGVEWQQSKQVQLDGSFGAEEIFTDQGFYVPKSIELVNDVSNRKQVSPGTARPQYTPFLEEHPPMIPTYYPTSTFASHSVAREPYPHEPLLEQTDSSNDRFVFHALCENQPTKLSGSQHDGNLSVRASPSFVINLSENIKTSCNEDDTVSAGKNPAIVDESYQFLGSENKPHFDASLVSFQLEQVEHISQDLSWRKRQELLDNNSSKFFRDRSFGVWPGMEVPYISFDEFDLEANSSKAFDSIEHCNPALDSPCWKGYLVSSLYSCESSEDVSPSDSKILDACCGSSSEGPQNFAPPADSLVNFSYASPMVNSERHDNVILTADSVSAKERTVEDSKCGTPQADPTSCNGLQNSDVMQEQKKEYSMVNKPIDIPNLNAPVENHRNGVAVAGVFYATSAKPTECDGRESTKKINRETLLSAMHNMSEVLLNHCSTVASDLKNEEFEALQKVINNLQSCVLKNGERVFSTKEPLPHQKDTSLSDLEKGTNVNITETQSIQATCECQHACRKTNHNYASKADGQFPDCASSVDSANRLKDDKMTQAIKQALSDNFQAEEETDAEVLLYKNLWLEAEASLCSATCMTRYNRMKTEIEKIKSQKTIALPEDTLATETPSSVHSFDHRNMKSWVDHLLGSQDTYAVEDLATSKVSPDPCKVDEGENVTEQGLPVDNVELHEASVMSRLHVLKLRDDNSRSDHTLAVEKVESSRSNFSFDLNRDVKADVSNMGYTEPGSLSHSTDDNFSVKNDLNQLFDEMDSASVSTVDKSSSSIVSPRLDISHKADNIEASVMSRYHMLKSRSDYCQLQDKENLQPEVVDNYGVEGILNSGSILQSYFASSYDGIATSKEFHPMVQSHQANAGWNEIPSSDWEHVLKAELYSEDGWN